MSTCARIEPLLHGYHDGELGALDRWRVRRHLERCAGCESELRRLADVGHWVRDALAPVAAVDSWARVGPQLAAIDSRLEAELRARRAVRRGLPQLLGPLGAGAALVAAAVVATVLLWPEPPQFGVVRSLYSHEQPVMVLDEADQATIIWVMDRSLDQRTDRSRNGIG